MSKEVNLSTEAKEALEIIHFLSEHEGEDIAKKYYQAESFIKERGTVSVSFLDSLRKQKAQLTPKT